MKKTTITIIALLVTLMLVLTGCGKGGNYDKAVALQEEGKYAEAIELYETLGDYEDSKQKLTECKYSYADECMTQGDYAKAIELLGDITDYSDAAEKLAKAERGASLAEYADAVSLLEKGFWFFYGGSDTAVNRIKFENGEAVICQITYNGNGAQKQADVNYEYSIDDKNITMTLADGSELTIAYSVDGETVKLGENEYFTAEEVDVGLQGYWSAYIGKSYVSGLEIGASEYIYCYNNGKVTFEHANAANSQLYSSGYFYYGPYEGTYEITENGLEADAKNNWQFGFNIIDGEVVMVRCEKVCERAEGFKGENGYEF